MIAPTRSGTGSANRTRTDVRSRSAFASNARHRAHVAVCSSTADADPFGRPLAVEPVGEDGLRAIAVHRAASSSSSARQSA